MQRAYKLCTAAWGEDTQWLYPETHWEIKYGIDLHDVQGGELVEIVINGAPEVGTPEIYVNHFKDPDFRIIYMVSADLKNVQPCVLEDRF